MSARGIALPLLVAVAVAGCRRGADDQETGTVERETVEQARQDLSPEAEARLDSGNAAYREERYQEALDHYQAVVRLSEGAAAGWFGIYMAELAMGNVAAADSAMARARALAGGATLIHPTPADSVEAVGDTAGGDGR